MDNVIKLESERRDNDINIDNGDGMKKNIREVENAKKLFLINH